MFNMLKRLKVKSAEMKIEGDVEYLKSEIVEYIKNLYDVDLENSEEQDGDNIVIGFDVESESMFIALNFNENLTEEEIDKIDDYNIQEIYQLPKLLIADMLELEKDCEIISVHKTNNYEEFELIIEDKSVGCNIEDFDFEKEVI